MATISPLQLRRSVSLPVTSMEQSHPEYQRFEHGSRSDKHELSMPSPAAASAAALAQSSETTSHGSFMELFPLDNYPMDAIPQHEALSPTEEEDYLPFQIESAPMSPKQTSWDFDSQQTQQLRTPMQHKRAGSLSVDTHIATGAHTGLYTPQSVSSGTWTTPLRGFSITDTPLATPLATPSEVLESPFEAIPSPASSVIYPTAPSADIAPANVPESGVNPFYCPPACMRMNDTLEVSKIRKKRVSPPMPSRSRSESVVSTRSVSDDRERELMLKPFKCDECQKCFRRAEHLRRHSKVHTQERPFTCPIQGCGRKFSRSDNLKAHTLTHAKKEGRNLYVEGLENHIGLVPTIKRRKSKEAAVPAAAAS